MVKTRVEVSDEAWRIVRMKADRDGITTSEALEQILRDYITLKPELKEWLQSFSEEPEGR